jgi:hypothetical protein
MQPAGQDPYRKYPQPPEAEPRSAWKDALLVAAFAIFIYIFVRTGGFFPSAKPTPTFRVPPRPTVKLLRTITPLPTSPLPTLATAPLSPELASRHPDIRGNVVDVYKLNDQVTGAYVRGSLYADTTVAQAFVKINAQTRLFVKSGGAYQVGDIAELTAGQSVEVLFAASASQPAGYQAVAVEIVILK